MELEKAGHINYTFENVLTETPLYKMKILILYTSYLQIL